MIPRSKAKQTASQINTIIWRVLTILLLFVSVLVSCSMDSDFSTDTAPIMNAINGYDPVAYFTESIPVPGTKDLTYVWNNARWFFSSKENLDLFKKNPAQYAPQYNGYCAFALSRNDCVEVSPDAWAIVNGKLYFTYNHDIKNAWLQDKENYIVKADRNWKNNKLSKKAI